MKKLVIILLVFFYGVSYGQIKKDNPVSVVSENRDTLFLVNNNVGCMIQEVWVENYEEESPVILMKSTDWILKETSRREEILIVTKLK